METQESQEGQKDSGRGLEPDEIVTELMRDATEGVPDLAVVHCYLGRSPTGKWRLHLSADMSEYVDVEEEDIKYSKQDDTGIGKYVWLRATQDLRYHRVQSEHVHAYDLARRMTQAHLGAAGVTKEAIGKGDGDQDYKQFWCNDHPNWPGCS